MAGLGGELCSTIAQVWAPAFSGLVSFLQGWTLSWHVLCHGLGVSREARPVSIHYICSTCRAFAGTSMCNRKSILTPSFLVDRRPS
jgi:hypothetical protein